MADRYSNFDELRIREAEGIDYRIRVTERESFAAIIAPHGGWIEPGTSKIAAAIAENVHSLYCFEGLRNRPHEDLHIKSTHFDEPRCLDLIGQCSVVVAVHGLSGTQKRVAVGGRDAALRHAMCTSFGSAGITSTIVSSGNHAAISPRNICNRGQTSAGVQLEITRGLRGALLNSEEELNAFAMSVQRAISLQQPK